MEEIASKDALRLSYTY